jgi:hypothetical protein
VAVNLVAEELRSSEVIRRFDGDSGRFWLIPWARRKRVARQSFSASRRGRGGTECWRWMAAELGSLRACTGKRNREGERTSERRKEEGGVVSRCCSRGVTSSAQRQVGGGEQEVASWSPGASTQLLCVPTKKTKSK